MLGAVSASVNTTSGLQTHFPWIILKGGGGGDGGALKTVN